MRTEEYEFPATATPLDTYIEHCVHSRPAHQFLSRHLGELGDDFSSIVRWRDADELEHFTWCYIQRIDANFILRVTHFDDETEVALTTAEALYHEPTDAILERALDVLDDLTGVPAQAQRDLVSFIKETCDEQLFEVTIAELATVTIEELQAKNVMIHELRAYCNALGA